ncbi:MAG: tRNA (cytidine(34)-2'-O)-methyltransferase [Candidatus Spyradocola sp.]
MHIVLVEPEIPQNTGNIARTCAATRTTLHLVHPLGFSIDEKQVRRAGLDYWHLVTIEEHPSFDQLRAEYPDAQFFYASTKAPRSYAEVAYPEDAFLVFGKETRGLPEDLLHDNYDRCVRIPMIEGARSLNLGNSVAIVLYEALRQQGFAGLKSEGHLTQY